LTCATIGACSTRPRPSPDPFQRMRRGVGRQLTRVRECAITAKVRPEATTCSNKPEHVVRVAVGGEPVRPVGDRAGADPDRVHRTDGEDRRHVRAQPFGGHHHRVAAVSNTSLTPGRCLRYLISPAGPRGETSARRHPRTGPTGSNRCSTSDTSGPGREVQHVSAYLCCMPGSRHVHNGHVPALAGRVRVQPRANVLDHRAPGRRISRAQALFVVRKAFRAAGTPVENRVGRTSAQSTSSSSTYSFHRNGRTIASV